ncbi:MAG: LytTR family DNA-binding domain-containing protein [Salinivirgaceae bacterium]|nr:LytTR family DNA-binding domain-containing protein [Salinivirgaceae bacterium]MDD4748327.1 LytTR family DNA-binding domain-containing protein [Salinivirgaceae bacterium]MDY0282273.1 LytTR family DNA-binding domain-containing protein [Salinivirgaceae bacterium]
MNCIIIDDDKLSRKIIESFVAKTDFLTLVASYDNAIDSIKAFDGTELIDLIFLDIEMPEMTGIEFLNTLENPPQVIIVTGKEKYAVEAFDYDVTDFLLKPISIARFLKSANKAHKRHNEAMQMSGNTKDEIFIKKKNSTLVRLSYDDILWVEALENYVIVSTYDDKFTIHFTMKAVIDKFPEYRFKRVHRSYIVNVSRIKMIEDNVIILDTKNGEKVIPIGKSFRDNLLNDLNLISK